MVFSFVKKIIPMFYFYGIRDDFFYQLEKLIFTIIKCEIKSFIPF